VTDPGLSPHDTAASAGLRFLVEVVAWVAGPWAAARLSGQGWVAVPTLVVLLVLPAAFNVPGDKKVTGIAVGGVVRIAIEVLLVAVAIGGAWTVWPWWAAAAVTALGIAMVATGLPRYRWLADHRGPF
jgi:hypothetical protein